MSPLFDRYCPECEFFLEDTIEAAQEAPGASVCPECGKETFRRLPSSGSFLVTGANASNGYSPV